MMAFFGWGVKEDMGEWDMAPLKSPIDPSPLILLQLIQFSIAPLFSAAEPLPSMNFLSSTIPDPEKGKNGVFHKDQT